MNSDDRYSLAKLHKAVQFKSDEIQKINIEDHDELAKFHKTLQFFKTNFEDFNDVHDYQHKFK